MHEHIRNEIFEYLQNGEGALLLKGAWGSGKTHFWKNYVENRISSSYVLDHLKSGVTIE